MFERFTQTALRAVFHARQHASQYGTDSILAEQLLLGVLLADSELAARLAQRGLTIDSVRPEVERAGSSDSKIGTAVDMPVSPEMKQALRYGVEEADAAQSPKIETRHLLTGLARIEPSRAARILIDTGWNAELLRALDQDAA